MTDAPERIWAYTGDGMGHRMTDHGSWDIGDEKGNADCNQEWPHVEYIRADLARATLAEGMRRALAIVQQHDTGDCRREDCEARRIARRIRAEIKQDRNALEAPTQADGATKNTIRLTHSMGDLVTQMNTSGTDRKARKDKKLERKDDD